MDLNLDVVALTQALIDVPSESRHEAVLADDLETSLRALPHLQVLRDGNSIVARTDLGRAERVIIAGHIDTVPSSGNDRSVLDEESGRVSGLGACDMKGGVAVLLKLASDVTQPTRDVTYVLYECEEIEATANGLKRIAETRPDLLAGDFAILMEPSDAGIEAGCQGTIRITVTARGRRAHTARAWMGENAIHRAADILARIDDFPLRRPIIDGLEYREGLQAVGISGGVAGNVVPDSATVTMNHRFAPDRTAAEAEALLREHFGGFEVVVVDVAEGALPGLTRPAAADFLAIAGGVARPKFGWTDVARFTALGIPAVNFGPADPALAHTPEEYVPIAHLRSVESQMKAWLSA